MKCPYCGHLDNRVVDSRLNKEFTITRRRRLCESCERRFTTYERLEVTMPMLVKKDGRRENWDRLKVVEGMKKACEKRPVSMGQIEEFVDEIEREFQDMGEREIPIAVVGEKIMDGLRRIDDVAYVRFASVYRQFKDLNEFMDELKGMLGGNGTSNAHGDGK
ncbi:MAG: transcriptional regulator NrdR [Proteobacteria bacterium]|nr:transcriptional repressor NrdR [Desulfobulbaceae bacterium]MBU4153198.1 transcriptional regulator NrdR [Pseudomonadota bacterium]MDP2106343.1 transcriptional regulator NrdR [Desulfobulbaceae bacterium]